MPLAQAVGRVLSGLLGRRVPERRGLGVWWGGSSGLGNWYGLTESTILKDPSELFSAYGRSTSGVPVSRGSALTYPAFWRAVSVICSYIGRPPLEILRRLPDSHSTEEAKEHQAYYLLRHRPNQYTSAYTFRTVIQSHALVEGNGYAYIFRRADGQPLELLPLDPCPQVTFPVLENGVLWYNTSIPMGREEDDRDYRKIPDKDVLHIHGLGYDGLTGYSILDLARENVGLGLAARQHGTMVFSNGAMPGGILTHPAKLSPDTKTELAAGWNKRHQGLENKHRVAILDNGMTFQPVSFNAAEAQLLQLLEHNLVDMANLFGLPASKLGHPGQYRNYNSLEMDNRAFLDEGMAPWYIAWEEECREKLLTEEEKRGETHLVKFDLTDLLMADYQTRINTYKAAIESGQLSIDEARAFEGMKPLPPTKVDPTPGKHHFRPLNLGIVGEQLRGRGPAAMRPQPDEPQPEEQPGGQDGRSAATHLLDHTITRLKRRVWEHAKRAAAKGKDHFGRFLAEFAEVNRPVLVRELSPVLEACAVVMECPGPEELASQIVQDLRGEFDLLRPEKQK